VQIPCWQVEEIVSGSEPSKVAEPLESAANVADEDLERLLKAVSRPAAEKKKMLAVRLSKKRFKPLPSDWAKRHAQLFLSSLEPSDPMFSFHVHGNRVATTLGAVKLAPQFILDDFFVNLLDDLAHWYNMKGKDLGAWDEKAASFQLSARALHEDPPTEARWNFVFGHLVSYGMLILASAEQEEEFSRPTFHTIVQKAINWFMASVKSNVSGPVRAIMVKSLPNKFSLESMSLQQQQKVYYVAGVVISSMKKSQRTKQWLALSKSVLLVGGRASPVLKGKSLCQVAELTIEKDKGALLYPTPNFWRFLCFAEQCVRAVQTVDHLKRCLQAKASLFNYVADVVAEHLVPKRAGYFYLNLPSAECDRPFGEYLAAALFFAATEAVCENPQSGFSDGET
jgi:hypothetical protein